MPKEITYKRLYNAALFYLSKYEAGTEKVRRVLLRRIQQATAAGLDVPEDSLLWIERILKQLTQAGYINDTRYARMQIKNMTQKGKSEQFIFMKLHEAGIDENTAASLIHSDEITDLDRAKLFIKRKKIGIWRPKEQRAAYLKKDLSALARAGFSYETAKAVLNLDS